MKEFKPTSWSIDNRTTIYIITLILCIVGLMTYNSMQKERFPDIVIPTVFVATVYPGTSPTDMENLVTRQIEKQVKSQNGVKKVSSTSVQDFSSIVVEFNTSVPVPEAKQRVKDAVDKAQSDLPNDLPRTPDVIEVNFAEFPIMFIHLSGPYDLDRIKKYAEDLQDKIEGLSEITRVDIVGALDREVQVDLDLYKLQAAQLTFADVERAIKYENMTISGGNITVGEMRRALQVNGQFTDPSQIGDIVVKNFANQPVYLKDVATNISLGHKERESYARLEGENVITLNIVKRSGENLIASSDKIQKILKDEQKVNLPKDLKITITGDQSEDTRSTLNDLINTIIIGFILVTLILMFYMGTVNALFVALSVPLSAFIAFIILNAMGFALNMIVLFSFLLALGIVVDDAIVVIENTHRIFNKTRMPLAKAAKHAAGEVFVPVLAGTLTTMAPFVPLAFWPGIVGKFMYYMPITLIVVLFASLIVAYIINPVFAVSFMKRHDDETPETKKKGRRTFWTWVIGIAILGIIMYPMFGRGMGNFTLTFAVLLLINRFVFTPAINFFQTRIQPKIENGYANLLTRILARRRYGPRLVLISLVALLIGSGMVFALFPPEVDFFPKGDPNFIYTYISMPVGTDTKVTDSVTKVVEKRVELAMGRGNPDVESIISNVAVGAGDPQNQGTQAESHKGKISVAFVKFPERIGVQTRQYLNKVRDAVGGIPGATITVDQESNGPPTGKAINIEVAGEDYPTLVKLSKDLERYLSSKNIAGIEDLQSDLIDKNPELRIVIDRERANREGISTSQIGLEIRTAVFGFEASKYKEDEDEYPIYVRYGPRYREDIDALMNTRITFRDMGGQVKSVPLSAVAHVDYTNTFGAIKRIDQKRVITLGSNILQGNAAGTVVANIQTAIGDFPTPEGYSVKMTGEQEQQKETSDFLGLAFFVSFGLIFLILVLQFNSFSKPIIIMSEIIFSIIGVLLGFSIFNMNMSIVMTGVGIVALAGIAVKNGILLVEFTDELKARGMRTIPAIIEAGRTRLNPVILTAMAAMLGLMPLALGLNIDFVGLFTDFKPNIFLGGESVTFWGPLAWTIIFGLLFATLITLIVVPSMYLMSYRTKVYLKRKGILSKGKKQIVMTEEEEEEQLKHSFDRDVKTVSKKTLTRMTTLEAH